MAYDGSKWTQACAVTPFSSATASVACSCNATQQLFAVALAEFSLDCKGVVGGLAAFDACKVCGGSTKDASLCSPVLASTAFPLWAAIVVAVGAAVLVAVSVFIVKVRQQRLLTRTKPVTAIDILSKDKASTASFVSEFAPDQIPALPEPPARVRVRPSVKTSRVDVSAPSLSPRLSESSNVSPRSSAHQRRTADATPSVVTPTHPPQPSSSNASPARIDDSGDFMLVSTRW